MTEAFVAYGYVSTFTITYSFSPFISPSWPSILTFMCFMTRFTVVPATYPPNSGLRYVSESWML